MHSLFPSLSLPPQEVEAIKEGYLDRAGRFQVYTIGNCPLYPQDCCNLTHTPVICTCTQPCVYIDTCLLLSVFIYCLRLFNPPTTTPLYCPTRLLSLQQPLFTARMFAHNTTLKSRCQYDRIKCPAGCLYFRGLLHTRSVVRERTGVLVRDVPTSSFQVLVKRGSTICNEYFGK